jgi:hypothetical protein
MDGRLLNYQCFFLLAIFFLKEKLKIPERNDFGGFQSSKARGKKKSKNHQIHILDFHCVAQNKERYCFHLFFFLSDTLKIGIIF